MKSLLRSAFLLLGVMSVLTGLIYPIAVTGLAAVFFPRQASGSLIGPKARPSGSTLIGQPFDDPAYFWGRPSSTPRFPYNASASGGSNLDLNNPALTAAVASRVAALRAADPGRRPTVPVDLVTGSASGLDPHITSAAAEFQVPRVARARGLTDEAVRGIVVAHTLGRTLGMLGEPRVNVLELNLHLDAVAPRTRSKS